MRPFSSFISFSYMYRMGMLFIRFRYLRLLSSCCCCNLLILLSDCRRRYWKKNSRVMIAAVILIMTYSYFSQKVGGML